MNSVVSLRNFANASSVPIVVFVDMQQEYVAAPRMLAISGIERSLDNCRKVFAADSSSRSMLIDAFHRNHKVTYLCDASASHALEDVSADEFHCAASKVSGLYGNADAWISSTTMPCKLEIGKNAGG